MIAHRTFVAATLFLFAAPSHALAQSLSIGSMFSRMQNKTIQGVTVVTHGYQFSDSGGDSLLDLAETIRSTIATQTGGSAWLLDYDVPDDRELGRFDLSHASSPPAGAAAGHVVLLWDWAPESNRPSPVGNPDGPGGRFADSAGDALFAFMNGLKLINPRNIAASPKLHMIAHSFGTGVNSEAVERMARFNVRVDNLTYLDPHDFDQAGVPVDEHQQIFTMGRPIGYGATVWSNVGFADVYYQTRGTQGGAVIGTANPEGRPIPGAHNRLLDTELPAGNPYGLFGTDSDHSYAWHTFYKATVTGQAPAGTFAPQQAVDYTQTGWAFSVHNANRIAPAPRVFYQQAGQDPQDHEHSETYLVNRATGQPNNAGLAAHGLTAQMITDARFDPLWPKTQVANGDFAGGYGRTPGSSDLIAGWSHHGGGGTGFVEIEGANHFLRLNFNEDNRTHNFVYVPINAKELRYAIRVRDSSSNDEMKFFIGDADAGQAVATEEIDVTSEHEFLFQGHTIPPALRGQTTRFGFAIEAPGIFNTVDSEVDLDLFRWALLNPILQATPAGGQLFDFGSFELNVSQTLADAVRLENVGEAQSVIDVQRFVAEPLFHPAGTPLFNSPDFGYTPLTAGGSASTLFALRFAGSGTPGVYDEIIRFETSEGHVAYLARAVVQPGQRWNLDGNGQWGVADNWLGPVPDAPGAQANFYSIITQPRTVTIVAPVTVGQITFANVNRYTLTGQKIILDNGAMNAATIALLLGNHTISAPIDLNSSSTSIVGPGLLTAGTINNFSSLTVSTGLSAVELVGPGDVTVNGGFVVANLIEGRFIDLENLGSVTLRPQRSYAGRWKRLDMNPNDPEGLIDLADNIVIVDYDGSSPIHDYRSFLRAGFGTFQNWNGTVGITSQFARDTLTADGIGYVEVDDLIGPAGGMIFGQPVDGSTLVLRYTLFGDSDLDGFVNIGDFSLLGAHFNMSGTWFEGDYDYDGAVLLGDFTRLAANFNRVLGAEAARAVPEPAAGLLAAWALLLRRRERGLLRQRVAA